MSNDSTSPKASAAQATFERAAAQQAGSSWRGLKMFPMLFAVLAVILLGLLIGLGLLVVVAVSYAGANEAPTRWLDRGWALLSAVAMAWSIVNVYWATRVGRPHEALPANLASLATARFGHLAIAIFCGLIAVGIHAVSVARAFGTDPIVMDYSLADPHTVDTAAWETTVIAGDAEEGRKVFSTTCITCHGPTGDGLPNLAPSLRGSPFIASSDDAAIAGVIRLGRAMTDPSNKTKKVMPARGGNPFLGDDKISHLVAFVRALQSEAPGAIGAGDPNAPPPVQLAKWVVPTASTPPTGIISLDQRDDIGDDESLALRDQGRRSGLVKTFTLALTGIHCLLLVGVMVASSNVLLLGLKEETTTQAELLFPWSILGWIVAAVVWLAVYVIGFVIL